MEGGWSGGGGGSAVISEVAFPGSLQKWGGSGSQRL